MGFALKGKVLKIDKENVINTCGRGHYVMYVMLTSLTNVPLLVNIVVGARAF